MMYCTEYTALLLSVQCSWYAVLSSLYMNYVTQKPLHNILYSCDVLYCTYCFPLIKLHLLYCIYCFLHDVLYGCLTYLYSAVLCSEYIIMSHRTTVLLYSCTPVLSVPRDSTPSCYSCLLGQDVISPSYLKKHFHPAFSCNSAFLRALSSMYDAITSLFAAPT